MYVFGTKKSEKVRDKQHFFLRDADMHSAYLLRRGGWLGRCLSVTRRYCIKTAKPILKLFRPSGTPIILVSTDPNSRRKPSAGALNTRDGKLAIFVRFSTEIAVYLGNGAR